MSNTASMLRLIEHIDSNALGINFDPSHLFPVGETPHVVIYQLAERIFHCHFSDNDGTTNVRWRPGEGKIDWEAVLVALRDTGYDGVISIELEDVPGVSRGLPQFLGSSRISVRPLRSSTGRTSWRWNT
jgi:sugar phosphate isomerase/epimerase